jgi:hypothetical protein
MCHRRKWFCLAQHRNTEKIAAELASKKGVEHAAARDAVARGCFQPDGAASDGKHAF